MRAAIDVFGEHDRFAGGWYGPQVSAGDRRIYLCAVDPSPAEIEALAAVAAESGWRLTVVPAKYSRAELLRFCESLNEHGPLGADALVSYGFDPVHNAIRIELCRPDDRLLAYARERIPDDAVRVEVTPRAVVAS